MRLPSLVTNLQRTPQKTQNRLGAVAAQAGVEACIAYIMECSGEVHEVYVDRLLAALSHLTGQTYTCENVGGFYLHREYDDIPPKLLPLRFPPFQ